ncbi:MAG TPA: phospholipase D-like domain-containing protein [Steroidobacteraceae bacterium]|jgi:cardiolipin synthase|nr:phospholipase D-like domain-containing protein [Steroidobacteraceae bacterium]
MPQNWTSLLALGLPLLHFALAASVTVHVLMTKRNPGSSVAWIGLAWLSPVIGSLLYALLGVNRVRRRARSLHEPGNPLRQPPPIGGDRSDHLAPLEFAGRRITQRCVAEGNDIRILVNGDAAYPQMLAAIDASSTSVVLSSYIFRADRAGNAFIRSLIAANQRGVEVRVLIDGYGAGYLWSRTYYELRRARVPVARFLHSAMPWRMPFLNLRSHRKILIVDGSLAFTGGLNIGAENLVSTHPRYPVLDTHFRVAGPVVSQLCGAFAELWTFTTGEALLGSTWCPLLQRAGDSIARAVTSGPDQDLEKIEFLVLSAVACAQFSIQIMTPYFLPDDRIITALSLAAIRGVTIDIVLPESSNHPSVDWSTRAHIEPLLIAGCRVWTHSLPFDHSKLLTVDSTWCFIGSANWDMRSFRLNFEINLEAYHSALVEQVSAIIRANQKTRLTLQDLERRSWPVRLRDSAARLMLPYL